MHVYVAWQELSSDFEVHADQVQEEERPSDPQPQQRPGIAKHVNYIHVCIYIMFVECMYIMIVCQWLTCIYIYIYNIIYTRIQGFI